MQLKRCEHGHYYDEEKHECCPYCGIQMGEPIAPPAYPDHYKTDTDPERKQTEPLHRPEIPVCIYAGPPLPEQPAPVYAGPPLREQSAAKKRGGFWSRFRKEK